MEIDYDVLRDYLINYFGSAIAYNPLAVVDINRAEMASNSELLDIARENKVDLSKFVKGKRKIYRL